MSYHDFLEMAVLLQKQLVEGEKNKLDALKAQGKSQTIQRDIMKKAVDLRAGQEEQAQYGQAMVGQQAIPVEEGSEELPFLDQATRRR